MSCRPSILAIVSGSTVDKPYSCAHMNDRRARGITAGMKADRRTDKDKNLLVQQTADTGTYLTLS
ncbi:hypothetical protein CY34DRAFT_803933 [Suillus luteus UH-Slu-Lm8-n1]|uniref:Uncharacterized protein n=1 Tax=Suillus luteus UH-Slu-Lm8-n1 TaxID=930992 RepID=A0A0D0BJC0_9AGAM|nr:hypothetical protein CY34DRAFT_803933 [Suillus luteus UH-Slu-Lm8-n1]